jgi:hypothetical protein
LLSSVDPVPNGDTNGPTHAPAVVSLAPSAAAVPASSLGPWRIVRCIVARFVHYALLHANSGQPILVSHEFWSANSGQPWGVQLIRHESSMMITRWRIITHTPKSTTTGPPSLVN